MFAATRGRGANVASALHGYSEGSPTGSSGPEWRNARGYTRGQGRGSRSRGRPYAFQKNPTVPQPPPKDLLDGLRRSAIQTFKDPVPMDVEEIVAKDVRYIASYSWLDSKEPTIIVPGSPRVWRNRPLPYTVTADGGTTCIYLNGERVPSSPLLPMFRAIETIQEDPAREKLDWSTVDFVTDRNNLRKLLGWIDPDLTVAEEFRIDLQLCGIGTVLMQRYEPRMMFNTEQSGFGDTFEIESTRAAPGCEEGALGGHHRIITYNLHGMKIMLRCEVDACTRTTEANENEQDSADDLADAFDSLSVSGTTCYSSSSIQSTASTAVDSPDTDIKIVRAGAEVSQASLVKIKTRSVKNLKYFNWSSAYMQLFLGQTPTLLMGVHQAGTFFELHECKMDSEVMGEGKRKAQYALKRLRRLLDEIHYIVMHHDMIGRLSLVCQGGGLKIYERGSTDSFLPEDILARF